MPTALFILAVIFWGASFIFIKIALQELLPFSFIFFRFLVAAMCLLPSLGYVKGGIKQQDIIRGTGLGLLMGGLIIFQTLGLQTVTASVAAFLTGFSVVFVLIIRFGTQKKLPSFIDIGATLACIFGLGLVTQSHGLTWELGIFYSLLAALFTALYIHALGLCASKSQLWVLTSTQMLVVTALAGLASWIIEGKLTIPMKAGTWGAIMACGILCTSLAFWIHAYAQQSLSPLTIAMLTTLESVFATLFSCIFLDEVLYLPFYAGAFLILVAIAVINWRLEVSGE